MKARLISKTDNALKVAFTAIRTCYSPYDAEYIWNEDYDKYVANNNDHIRLIKQILGHGHTSTLEHIQFNFAIEGVSRALLAQLTRHRIGFSYSVQSQRYVKQSSGSNHGPMDYVIPDKIRDNEQALGIYNATMKIIQESYDKLVSLGIKAEDARYVLPNAAETNLVVSMNLRAFMEFYNKRKPGTHAQAEIQQFAELLKNIIEDSEPWTVELFK